MKFLLIAIISTLFGFSLTRYVKKSMRRRAWIFPVLLASLPFFYFSFALWVNDKNALKNELIVSALFFIIVIIYIRNRKQWAEQLLAAGFLLHAVYDITHSWYFENLGVPTTWPVFCGVLNLFIGAYLFYLHRQRVIYRV